MYRVEHQKYQQGAALIVSLVVLALVTVLGVSSMQTSNTELIIEAKHRDRSVAFEAAEAALALVEAKLLLQPPQRSDVLSHCSGDSCFNQNCVNGLCFLGKFEGDDEQIDCQVIDTSKSIENKDVWLDSMLNVWSEQSPSVHQLLKINGLTTDVKYITEFLCFVDKSPVLHLSTKSGERNNGTPLFRITVLAQGNSGQSSVALQSTYTLFGGLASEGGPVETGNIKVGDRLSWRELNLEP